jgi:hypothetical protein
VAAPVKWYHYSEISEADAGLGAGAGESCRPFRHGSEPGPFLLNAAGFGANFPPATDEKKFFLFCIIPRRRLQT